MDLYVLPAATLETASTGADLAYERQVIRERECPGRFVVLSNALPTHVRFISASNPYGTVQTNANGSVVFQCLNDTKQISVAWHIYADDSSDRLVCKSGDSTRISPSELWIFVDEHPDSINDGCLVTDMRNTNQWTGLPSSLHGVSRRPPSRTATPS